MGGGRGGKIGHAIVWDVKTGKRVTEIGKEFDQVMSADISPDHRRVVLATNSLWDYTDVVMRFLLGGGVSPTTGSPLWLDLFDVVVTGCGKPAFFKEARPLLEVDPATGLLRNTDSGTPMVPIGEADLPSRGGGGSGGSSGKGAAAAATSTTASRAPSASGSSSSSSSFASGASTSTTHPSVQMASRRGPARVFQGGCVFSFSF